MPSERSSTLFKLVVLVLSSAALYFGTGLHPIWWLTWLAPIPVLLAAPRLSPGDSFAVAFLAWAGGGLNIWRYYHNVLQIPVGTVVVAIAVPAIFFGIAVFAYRGALRQSAWRATLIFPCIWVTYEFVNALLSPHSTAGNISYSQMNFLPAIQLASVTGIWGISFCIFLFAAGVGVLLGSDLALLRRLGAAAGVAIILAAVFQFGQWRLRSTPNSQPTVAVGLVASDLSQNVLTEERADTLRLLHEYALQAESLAAQGAQVIVIPEKVAVLLDDDLHDADSTFQATAAKTKAAILVGVVHPTGSAKWNEARYYSPDGQILLYEKHHMVPGWESKLTVGTARTEWREPSGEWAIAICKDMDFPDLSRAYGRDGVGLMLVPAWDFRVDGWLHGRMGILRGVESGFSIARSPKEGILTVTDDMGRVLSERNSNAAPFSSLVASVPVRHRPTLYSRFGNWFAWTNMVLLIGIIASGMGQRRS